MQWHRPALHSTRIFDVVQPLEGCSNWCKIGVVQDGAGQRSQDRLHARRRLRVGEFACVVNPPAGLSACVGLLRVAVRRGSVSSRHRPAACRLPLRLFVR